VRSYDSTFFRLQLGIDSKYKCPVELMNDFPYDKKIPPEDRIPAGKSVTSPFRDRTMTAWLKLLTVSILLVISACVSAGTRAITDAGVVSQIEVGKSTRADVTALLGYPITASYGDQGDETWHYTLVTASPTPTAFVPVLKAVTPSLKDTTRELAVTFSRDGAVKSLGFNQPPKNPAARPQGDGSAFSQPPPSAL
jgi:outer membrane protein assembly factor BamE (lipoprotein component of BamABCDE complex)